MMATDNELSDDMYASDNEIFSDNEIDIPSSGMMEASQFPPTIVMIREIVDAYNNANTNKLYEYKDLIKYYWKQSQHITDSTGSFIHFIPEHRSVLPEILFIHNLLLLTPNNDSNKQEKQLISLEYIIKNIINISEKYGFKNNTLLLHDYLLINKIYDKMFKDKFDLLFKYTSDMEIKKYKYKYNENNTDNFLTIISSLNIPNEYFDYIYDKVILTGIQINQVEISKYGKKITFLDRNIINIRKKYVKIALDAGCDPNLYIHTDFISSMTHIEYVISYNRYTKCPKKINDIVEILIMLIDAGLNRNYINTDRGGHNIMDYICAFGWGDIPYINDMQQITNFSDDLLNKYIGSFLSLSTFMISRGFLPSKFKKGDKIDSAHLWHIAYTDIIPDLIPELSKSMKLLYDYRHEKNIDKIMFVLSELKKMKIEGEDFKQKVQGIERYIGFSRPREYTLYELFCSHLGYLWSDGPVYEWLTKECIT